MINDIDFVWFSLRDRRASLRKQSRPDETASRRKSFAAAMRQFEEQMTAAKVVSPATRPLNLYYALVQAGYAIQAAHAPGQWSFSRHGLTLGDTAADLPDILVQPHSHGAFQAVATTTGSTGVTTEASIGALWASLPDLGNAAHLYGSNHHKAIGVWADTKPANPIARITVNGYAYPSTPSAPPPPPSGSLIVDGEMPDGPAERQAWLTDVAAHYPAARDVAIAENVHESFRQILPRRFEVRVHWPHPAPGTALSEAELEAFFNARVPQYLYGNDWCLRPSVEGDAKPPSALMTWWLLLYSFSMLARYQPAKWMDLLDVDRSKQAVALEYALSTALDVIPQLVLEALDREPVLLQKPMRF